MGGKHRELYGKRSPATYPGCCCIFEENLGAKKPVIKTGAEIPFTRYFYKYQQPTASEELEAKFSELELSVSERVAKLFE